MLLNKHNNIFKQPITDHFHGVYLQHFLEKVMTNDKRDVAFIN